MVHVVHANVEIGGRAGAGRVGCKQMQRMVAPQPRNHWLPGYLRKDAVAAHARLSIGGALQMR